MSSHNKHNNNHNYNNHNHHNNHNNNHNYYNKNNYKNNNYYNYNNHTNFNTSNNFYSEEEFETKHSNSSDLGAFLAFVCMIPGSIFWIILSYHTPFASLMAIFITLGGMIGYKLGSKQMTYKAKTTIIIFSSILMFALTTLVTSYTLYKQYNTDILKKSTIDELRESFITNLKNNGKSIDETETMLKNEYNINGFDDIEGLNNLVKNTLAETYKDSHRVSHVPDTMTNSVLCLFQSLAYNRTIAKPFCFNIIAGIIICILTASGLIKINYFKPFKI